MTSLPLALTYPAIISGIIYLGFLILLLIAVKMLPSDSPKTKQFKLGVSVWVLLAALWLIFKPH